MQDSPCNAHLIIPPKVGRGTCHHSAKGMLARPVLVPRDEEIQRCRSLATYLGGTVRDTGEGDHCRWISDAYLAARASAHRHVSLAPIFFGFALDVGLRGLQRDCRLTRVALAAACRAGASLHQPY